MARLREPRERRRGRGRFRYWRAAVRLCQATAIALVKYVDRAAPLKLCARHLERDVVDRSTTIEWFEELYVSRRSKAPRDMAAALVVAERFCINRAPIERRWESLDTRERKRRRGRA